MTADSHLPTSFLNETELDEFLSRPSKPLLSLFETLDGDIVILGIGGKMGTTLGLMTARAVEAVGSRMKVYGVSRFSDSAVRTRLETGGVSTIACDLLDQEAVSRLPKARNVIYMAGRKFGTQENEAITWMVNVAAPNNVCSHYRQSRIVAFSTGCVYPLVSVETGGSREHDPTGPVGEYAQSCLGRERVFAYWSLAHQTEVCLFRLNYAVDLRYGVLHDIADKVFRSQPVDLSVSHFNVIWQGDACEQALRCLQVCTSPAQPVNVTGRDIISVRAAAEAFGQEFGLEPVFTGSEQGSTMYLSDSSKAALLFGNPSVPLQKMIAWQAGWTARGGRSLGKPTHFDVQDGKF